MPDSLKRAAHDYAERIRERLPRRLQKNQILTILLPPFFCLLCLDVENRLLWP